MTFNEQQPVDIQGGQAGGADLTKTKFPKQTINLCALINEQCNKSQKVMIFEKKKRKKSKGDFCYYKK